MSLGYCLGMRLDREEGVNDQVDPTVSLSSIWSSGHVGRLSYIEVHVAHLHLLLSAQATGVRQSPRMGPRLISPSIHLPSHWPFHISSRALGHVIWFRSHPM